MGRKRGPACVTEQVDFAQAELAPDADRPGCWTLLLDGTPQSHVDLGYPSRLHFEYMRWLGNVADAVAARGEPLKVLHLGGGAFAVPRYIAATRPGSSQLIVERDAALVAMVKRLLPLPPRADIKVKLGDARTVVESLPPRRFDLVFTDVYCGVQDLQVRFSSAEYAAAVARLLAPGGVHAVNVIDGPPLDSLRSQLTAAGTVFAEVALLGAVTVLHGKRFGNLILVATDAVNPPWPRLSAAAAREPVPVRLLHGAEVRRFAAGALPLTEGRAAPRGATTRPLREARRRGPA